jgi:hypothetical protein
MRKYPRSPMREYKRFLLRIFLSYIIEHDLPLPMILMGELLANYVKSLDYRYEPASEASTKTGNELLQKQYSQYTHEMWFYKHDSQ